tara:strand:+ start:3719 stop:4858 length:1140 start_codon:yes stop_codon:yes gene_type:complete
MNKIPFNKPPITGNEINFIEDAINSEKLSGDGAYSKKCQEWFEERLRCEKALLTPSCTAALEMAAILCNVKPGDEVIMPSYTFVSTANAFALRGATIIFVDIDANYLNIDIAEVEKAITEKTVAVVAVHYAGVSCEIDKLKMLCESNDLFLIEDAAQALMSTYKGIPLGTFGHLSTFSFHETKNYTSGGEGGLLVINDIKLVERAEIVREKGTNRSKFFKGHVDKYTWVDIGGSQLPSEIQAAFLWAQLNRAEEINTRRLQLWNKYNRELSAIEQKKLVALNRIPQHCEHNAHIYYLLLKSAEERDGFLDFMKANSVLAVFHYIPLHSSPAGLALSKFHGVDRITTSASERLVRLPLFYNMKDDEQARVIDLTKEFFDI